MSARTDKTNKNNKDDDIMMQRYYTEELSFPSWLLRYHTGWPYLNGGLQLGAVAAAMVPILRAHYVYDNGLHILELILVVIGFAAAAPFFMLAWFWHPCPVHTNHDDTSYPPRSVDVCVTMYKEDLDVIRGTLLACQAIQNGDNNNTITVYALDDGNRPEVAEMCHELNHNTSVGGGVHPIQYE